MLKKIAKFIWDYFDDILTFILFVSLFATILLQLVLRIFFNGGLVWTEELSRLFLMYACFASLPRVLKKREELKLTIVVEHLNEKQKLIFDIVVQVLSIATFIFLIYWGIQTVVFQSRNIMAALRFSMGWMYIAFPISMFFGLLRSIQMIWEDCQNMKTLGSEEVKG